MKKLVTAMAACALAGAVFAQVQSVNIVGYTTETTPVASYKMLGVVFTPVGDPSGTSSFTSLVTGAFAAGDEVQFLLANGTYKVLNYYVGNLISADFTQFNLTGWGQGGIQADHLLKSGEAFWIKTGAAVGVVQAGQVQIAANNQITTPAAAYTMVSAPYPVGYNLSALTFTGVQAGDEAQFLLANGTYKVFNYYVGNLISSDFTQFNLTGWGQGGIQADQAIASGEGFWVKTAAATTITFTSPL